MTELAVAPATAPPDPYASWLDQLARDPAAAGAPPSTDELLARLAEDNPRLAGLVRYLTAADATAEAAAAEPEDEPEPGRRADVGELLVVVRRLHAEVEELRHRNDLLAEALGACYLCWGDDPDCPRCRGRGTPGAVAPEPRGFTEWVLPAVRRVARARRAAVPRSTTPDTVRSDQ